MFLFAYVFFFFLTLAS